MVRYLKNMQFLFLCYKRQETAATAVEYGLIIAFISTVIMVTVMAIGGHLEGFFNTIHEYISSVL